MKFSCVVNISRSAWPVPLKYNPVDWVAINQLEPGVWVDVVGYVVDKKDADFTGHFPKMQVELGRGHMQLAVTFLGELANVW